MMKIFLLLSMLIISSFVKSQNLKLSYDLEFIKDTIKKSTEKRSMILLIERQNYLFSSEKFSTDTIENDIDYPILQDEDIEFSVIKKGDILNKMFYIDQNVYSINENFINLNWKITDQKKNIDNIECQLATLKYKGRNWNAWFSTKYPINFGPYIFNGLPGAIIELYDKKRYSFFKLTKISNSKNNIEKLIKLRQSHYAKPIIINRKQLSKLYLSNYSSPYKRMKEKQIIYMVDEKTGEHQPPPDFDKMTKSAQKYIRENNNPIELSEATKYP